MATGQFKVTQGHRLCVCDFLLLNNTNLGYMMSRIVMDCRSILVKLILKLLLSIGSDFFYLIPSFGANP